MSRQICPFTLKSERTMAQYMKPSYLSSIVVAVLFLPHIVNSGAIRKVSSSISCYQCNSRNWTDINCHDPFNPAMSKYSENCKVPKPNHVGVFPARFCVKVTGRKLSTGETLVIRSCSLENMDNQCGNFKFEGDVYKGCILTCDYDGCNMALSNMRAAAGKWTLFAGLALLGMTFIYLL